MSDPSDEERRCLATGLRVLTEGATISAARAAPFRISRGIPMSSMPIAALYDENPLERCEPVGRRFVCVRDGDVVACDLSCGDDGPMLVRTAIGPLAEGTLSALQTFAEIAPEKLAIVRVAGLSAEALWVPGGEPMTILPPNGADEGDGFIEDCRRAVGRQTKRGNGS